MRFSILAALLLGVAAHPAEKRDSCCCCDVHLEQVICQEATNCVCPGVMCPAYAPTVWRGAAAAAKPTGVLAKRADDDDDGDDDKGCEARSDDEDLADEGAGDECCCCDASKGAIVCNSGTSKADCYCPAIACPTNAPTIYETQTSPTETETATASASPSSTGSGTIPPPDPAPPCCCCDAGRATIVCEMRSSDSGDLSCMCPMVVCPPDAPTVTVWPDESTTTS